MVINDQNSGENSFVLESLIETMELNTVIHPDSPIPHYLLASLYQALPEELSPEVRQHIEDEKLRTEGREGILDMPRNVGSIIATMGSDPTVEQRFSAAYDYIHSANILDYLREGNVQRAVGHLQRAMSISRENPELYENTLNSTLLGFIMDERFQKFIPLISLQYEHP